MAAVLKWLLLMMLSRHISASPPPPLSGTLAQLDDRTWTVNAVPESRHSIQLTFPSGPGVVLADEYDDIYVLPTNAIIGSVSGNGRGWVLPDATNSSEHAWMISATGSITISYTQNETRVTVKSTTATLKRYQARPHADINGDEFKFCLPGFRSIVDAMAGFYWGTLLPSVVERTLASTFPDSDGFVLSTLASKYAGTYPDVDHEFQSRARHAIGSALDLSVARRMAELGLRLVTEDPCGLGRVPCAVQPDGTREWHVRRNSLDGSVNANMFLVTGNIELIEAVWMYVTRTKDMAWLNKHIEALELASGTISALIDENGRLWGDVYYEDQVMKDGRETLAQALAARSFRLMAQLQHLLGRIGMAFEYNSTANKLLHNIAQPLPLGYWNPTTRRFVDWIDRLGVSHDHIHLLANVLPVLLGAADADQSLAVLELMENEKQEFQRFPSFIAARVEDYTASEMGIAGPYDLCAAGRYWFWDAAYWTRQNRGDIVYEQLQSVAAMGAREGYIMGERYDMDHVYYVDGRPWHGAAHYYEYPCTFIAVLMSEFLGLSPSLEADLRVSPRLLEPGSVVLEQQAYQISFEYQNDAFKLKNLAHESRTFQIDVSALFPDAAKFMIYSEAQDYEYMFTGEHIIIGPHENITIAPIILPLKDKESQVQILQKYF